MQPPQQLPLFRNESESQNERIGRGPLDSASEALLATFRAARLASGANANSIERDISQLRSLARTSALTGGLLSLAGVLAQPIVIAHALCDPPIMRSRETMRARLRAVQSYLRHTCTHEGRDAVEVLAALDRMLPSKPEAGWHTTGIQLAGTTARRRRRGPLLDISDLTRIVAAAGESKRSAQVTRDRALVALRCFTGLRTEEVLHLQWEHVVPAVASPGRVLLMTRVQRGERLVDVPIDGLAADALMTHAATHGQPIRTLTGPIFRATSPTERTLGYRASHNVLCTACRIAGFPHVQASDLRAAYAHWLGQEGNKEALSDHQIMAVLGLARVKSVDRLLRRHFALDAQRMVRNTSNCYQLGKRAVNKCGCKETNVIEYEGEIRAGFRGDNAQLQNDEGETRAGDRDGVAHRA